MYQRRILAYRYESFGGILHLMRPPMLVWVDRDYMRGLGYPDAPIWDQPTGLLSAPLEVHAMLSRRCSAGCRGCYAASTLDAPATGELDLDGWQRVIDVLARMRVFHVALGGGESLELPWLFALARYSRAAGVVPNLTTNGFLMDERRARASRVFGQINVSVDGLGPRYRQHRGVDGFARADRALTLLRQAGCRFGINTVVSRRNFGDLEDLVRYARAKRVNQVELLRFKPAGRGRALLSDLELTRAQAQLFYPLVRRLQRRYGVSLRVDCSFMPQVFAHAPDLERASFFQVAGCHAGQLLAAVLPDGRVSGCSFATPEPFGIDELPARWPAAGSFALFRGWHARAPEPCRGCRYLALCLGGCHVVAEAAGGDPRAADPGCPLVVQVHGRPRPVAPAGVGRACDERGRAHDRAPLS